VGLEPGSQLPTSFMVLADPKFQQTRPLLAGLDFAFPSANKARRPAPAPPPPRRGRRPAGTPRARRAPPRPPAPRGTPSCKLAHAAPRPRPAPPPPPARPAQVGGVVSSGQRYKRRAMYAWSADAPVRPGGKRRQQLLRQRRAAQQERAGSPGAAAPGAARQQQEEEEERQEQQRASGQEQQQQQQQQPGRKQPQGFLGSLLSRLGAGFGDDAGRDAAGASGDSEPSSSSGGGGERGGAAAAALSRRRARRLPPTLLAEREEDEGGHDSGLHMYGAAVLALRGGVYFDPITSQVGGRVGGGVGGGWGCGVLHVQVTAAGPSGVP
jgi:hypothetical protein